MRIVGGRLRGRPLAGPRSQDIRPTSDRLRETLFNILHHAYGLPEAETRVLDLFAGTGVEGRGLIRSNIETLGLTGVTRILRRDATDLGKVGTNQPFDLVFCDPPYGKGLGEKALAAAAAGGWLKPDALCVLEERAGTEIALPGFEMLDRRETGDSQLVFARVRDAA